MSERVSLPDPRAQRLLHPADVAQAHPAYVRGWAMSVLAAPEVLTLVGSLAWVLSGSWVAPTLAVLTTGVVAEMARRHLMGEAWAHIPRKRQDRTPDTPAPYALVEAIIRPAAMAAGVMLVLAGLTNHGAGVRSLAFGSAAGVVLALMGVPLMRWLRTRSSCAALEASAGLACVIAGIGVASFAGWIPEPLDPVAFLLGLGMLVVVYATWLGSRRLRSQDRSGPA
ncbi:hypothetical protein [Nocardioides sp. zg-1230]|uniref:hypothetical protein n=1 Tax=Nocardioides sp. zg-1230 TaxID=2736601 RepID=UPI0015531DA4|nr:hypothetical protein [Nocardioides sp. zg-1230]NPC44151.1 hypothetical protein [Nocardioides sp. zg-1230]